MPTPRKPQTNQERFMRAISTLQLIQRTDPASSMAKAAGRALVPLLKEQATMAAAPPIVPAAPLVGSGG